MTKVRAAIGLIGLGFLASQGAYSANCSCWGGGAIVGLTGCSYPGGTGEGECETGYTLFCT